MRALYNFFHSDSAGGVILLMCAVLAMLIANSPLAPVYQAFLDQTFTVGFTTAEGAATLAFQKPLLLWINDLLMTFFFLYAGLEIKREIKAGALSSRDRALLPIIAAICGMAVPAAIYLFLNRAHPQFSHGWAIPSATDIAFAVGVLALAASRVPSSVKILLLAIAVMDDLGAIIIIALFYSHGINLAALGVAAAAVAAMAFLNRLHVCAYAPYFMVGFILWAAMFKGGIHPTLAGVVTAFCIPMMDEDRVYSPVEALEHMIKPWVVFAILPVFGFANAGVSLEGLGFGSLFHPVTLGIALGLFFGKQIGIFGSIYLAVKTPYFLKPAGASWMHLYGMSLLCGIGFTMALFVGGLAFTDPAMAAYVRMGVMGGSLLSAICGYTVICLASRKAEEVSYE